MRSGALLVLGGVLSPAIAHAQANLYVPDATVGVEDIVDPGTPDRDQNDVAVRYNRHCRMDASGLLVADTLRIVGLSAGASRTNALRLGLPASPASITVTRGAAVEAGVVDGAGRVRLWDDFRDAFTGASGFVNTGDGPWTAAQPLRVDVTYAPGVDTGGACPAADFVVVREAEGVAIDRTTTLSANGQPLLGQFPGVWSVLRETRPIEEGYPRFVAWLADQVNGCPGGCDDEDWYLDAVPAHVVVRTDLPTSAPLEPAPTCGDGVQNQDESGVDCGGDVCPACVALTACDGSPVANGRPWLAFSGTIDTLSGPGTASGPGLGDPLEGWVAWDPSVVDDLQPTYPQYGTYCYGDLPAQFQMVVRSGSYCWETLDGGYTAASQNTCQLVRDDVTPAWDPVPHDYLELFTWELGPEGPYEYALGSLQLVTHTDLGAIVGDEPPSGLPPASTFDQKLIYVEAYPYVGAWRGFEAHVDALTGSLLAPEPPPAPAPPTWVYATSWDNVTASVYGFADANDDGDALDPGEAVLVHTFPTRVMYAAPGYDGALYALTQGGQILRAYDADDDGSIDTHATFADVTARPGRQDLVVGPSGSVYLSTTSGVWRYRDGNGDQDASDPGEEVQYGTYGTMRIHVAIDPSTSREIVWGQYYEIVRHDDVNGDGDATDPGEAGYKGFDLPGCGVGLALGVAVSPDGVVHGLHQDSGACPNKVSRFVDLNGDGDFYEVGEYVGVGTYAANVSNSIGFTPAGDLLATTVGAGDGVLRLTDTDSNGVFETHVWATGLYNTLSLHVGPAVP